jgi:hypothetical protein
VQVLQENVLLCHIQKRFTNHQEELKELTIWNQLAWNVETERWVV